MLRIEDITFSVEGRHLFQGASATVPAGHKVGLVGRNGAGKTTLFRLIRGELALEGGAISLPPRTRIGGVAQEVPSSETSLLDTVMAADTERAALLADRMAVAIDLYESGKVNKLLLTGDNRFVEYNEPAAMAEYALARGVPGEDLVLDYAGRRTYDSCYRARAIFGVSEAVLVTQEFHLPRALYTCDRLGLDVVGVAADQSRYIRSIWFNIREVMAAARAWFDLNLLKPLPVLGDPIPVDWSERTDRAHRLPPGPSLFAVDELEVG